jgi:hypothetical protein
VPLPKSDTKPKCLHLQIDNAEHRFAGLAPIPSCIPKMQDDMIRQILFLSFERKKPQAEVLGLPASLETGSAVAA